MKIFLLFFIFLQLLHADNNLTKEVNASLIEMASAEAKQDNQERIAVIKDDLEKKKLEEAQKLEKEKQQRELLEKQKRLAEAKELQERIKTLVQKNKDIDEELSQGNIWVNQYSPYETYKNFDMKLQVLLEDIKEYTNKKKLTETEKSELKVLEEEREIVAGKITQLDEYKTDPLTELIEPNKLDPEPVLNNPLDILAAMSYQKHLKSLKDKNDRKYASLSFAVKKIREKKEILQELSLRSDDKKYVEALEQTENKLKDFEYALAIFKTSITTFSQKVSQINLNINKGIENEIKKSIVTGVTILVLLLIFLLVKYLVRKYMSDNDLFYGINKVVNFMFIFMVFIILLATYLENVENLMTILSFASAGIAIALKDWFMSLLGWFVILVSGSIHVGDRVKFVKDGMQYVGDIVDISVLRMTLHEDVTLTTLMVNKRSGRIIFIPNNYIFTDVIANYSHADLKTVWDVVEFIVTFDSNIPRVHTIAKDVSRKYSKGYTDMTRKQLNRLRSKYSVRNTGVEPRITTIFEPYGMRISAWFLTNAYATLTLKTTITVEILRLINEADDIHLALPSQSLYMNDAYDDKKILIEGEEPPEHQKI